MTSTNCSRYGPGGRIACAWPTNRAIQMVVLGGPDAVVRELVDLRELRGRVTTLLTGPTVLRVDFGDVAQFNRWYAGVLHPLGVWREVD